MSKQEALLRYIKQPIFEEAALIFSVFVLAIVAALIVEAYR